MHDIGSPCTGNNIRQYLGGYGANAEAFHVGGQALQAEGPCYGGKWCPAEDRGLGRAAPLAESEAALDGKRLTGLR